MILATCFAIMTIGAPDNSPELSPEEIDAMLLALRRKQGTWTTWGDHCQQLRKVGYSDQAIFEATGFEPIQQNQIMVAAQVYKTIVQEGAAEAVQTHFGQRASDILYEFRILSPSDRTAAAEFAFTRQMDMMDAREMAKAIKDFCRISQPPTEFTNHPGDILAYFAWRAAKQKTDLQARSLLIAKGLKYAQTEPARRQIERLLTDFSTTPTQHAPRLPVYRLESD
ncbi:MAG: RuBisCO accumulation factor 1, partial [Synechococcales bacterium]|nr:RuBisCO accumulation factor 1 [Synechococcales bacterium]